MPDQVPEAEKGAQRKTACTRSQDVGGVPPVLSRQTGDGASGGRVLYDGKRYYTGYTKEYVKVAVETKRSFQHVCDGHLKDTINRRRLSFS